MLWEWCRRWSTTSLLDRGEWDGMHSAMHSPRSPCTENVEFIGNGGYTVVARRYCRRYLLRTESSTKSTTMLNGCFTWKLVIIYGEFGPKEVRSGQIVRKLLKQNGMKWKYFDIMTDVDGLAIEKAVWRNLPQFSNIRTASSRKIIRNQGNYKVCASCPSDPFGSQQQFIALILGCHEVPYQTVLFSDSRLYQNTKKIERKKGAAQWTKLPLCAGSWEGPDARTTRVYYT